MFDLYSSMWEKWKVWVLPDTLLSTLTFSWEGDKQSFSSGGCAQVCPAKWMMKVLNGHLDLSCVRSPKTNGLGYMIGSRQTLQYPVRRCAEANSMKDERKRNIREQQEALVNWKSIYAQYLLWLNKSTRINDVDAPPPLRRLILPPCCLNLKECSGGTSRPLWHLPSRLARLNVQQAHQLSHPSSAFSSLRRTRGTRLHVPPPPL